MRFSDDDFVPLEECPLGWRWIDPKRGLLPADLLASIHPLRAERAGEIAEEVRENQRALEGASATVFRADDPIPLVRQRLEALPVALATRIVISWDARTAVVSEWEVFASHWDRFCYPRTDDVTIRPVNGGWALRYYRYEVFGFALSSRVP